MLISGIVTAANLLLSLLIGIQLLLRMRRHGPAPETALAAYFLFAAFLGACVNIGVYGSMADDGLSIPSAIAARLLATGVLLNGVGALGVYLFTWLTFRPDRRWARALVASAAAVLALGFVVQALTEGFAIVVFPGLGYWIGRLGFVFPFAWIAVESFRYHRILRRRLRLGLAEPVVTNRFLLWGVWSTATAVNAASDLVACGMYYAMTGETSVIIVEAVAPIIVATVAVTSAVGTVAAATLLLTFFPTHGYRRWVERRATRLAAVRA